jgi:uncharacterized protein (DUF2252 family)
MSHPSRSPGRHAPFDVRFEFGKSRRVALPRVEQAIVRTARRYNPVKLLLAASKGRVQDVLPIRWGRMAASPFGFFRGAAPVMAADLGLARSTGIRVQLCGDAHVRNLGAFAAPDGHLVFDVNDFDESIPGPFEWDLKRLATSFVLAGREAGDPDALCGEAVLTLVRSYREALATFASMTVLDLFRYEISRLRTESLIYDVLRKAERASPVHNITKLTVTRGKAVRVAHRPPLLARVAPEISRRVLASLRAYRETLGNDHQLVLDAYQPADVAFKVVGTGSVGLRDYVVLAFGSSRKDPLFLQVKQESPSCWAPYVTGVPRVSHEGRRVAEAQHRLQTVSDPFLGWTSIDGRPYLVRQLADHKAAVEPNELAGKALLEYAAVCGEIFAKGHARTGDPAVLLGYCGRSARLDKALRQFAFAYADRTTEDHANLLAAIRRGSLRARRGL